MTPKASVVIVSRGRGPQLSLCLLALEFQSLRSFEVIVVGDEAARRAVIAGPGRARVQFAPCEAANISVARNIGLSLARAACVAFLDDDCVPEPCWLAGLLGALGLPGAVAAAGYVRGPDGIAFQWRGEWLDPSGLSYPMVDPPTAAQVMPPDPPRVPGVMGTNFAVKRDAARRIGGFDVRLRYYLDESDLILRLSAAGGRVAYAPQAQVHHHLAAGLHRRADRVPRDLFEVGRSVAVHTQTHVPEEHQAAIAGHRDRQRSRLLRAMVAGRILPDQVWLLLRSFDRGVVDGSKRVEPASQALPISSTTAPPLYTEGLAHPSGAPPIWIDARHPADSEAFAKAHAAAQKGCVVTVIASVPARYKFCVIFQQPGIWVHRVPEKTGSLHLKRHNIDRISMDYSEIRGGNKAGV